MKRLIFITIIVLYGVTTYAQDLPCAGYDMQSDELFYRGSGSGVDTDSITARRKAIMMARQSIVTQVEVVVNSAIDLYIKTFAFDVDAQTGSYMRSQSKIAANKLLVGSQVICEKTVRRLDDMFESSIAVEVKVADVMSMMEDNSNYQIDWEKYKEILHTQLQNKQ